MRLFKTILLLLTTALLASSCLNDNDSSSTNYNDAAISAFSIGTLKRTVHTTTKAGADSTYITTVTGSNYNFEIDQTTHRIFNTDSLPLGTNVSRVLTTITAYNNGTILLKDMESDTLRYYQSSDSIDFTKPRKFHVYSYDGSGNTEYTVSVNVHQENPDAFVWTLVGNNWTPEDNGTVDLAQGIRRILGKSTTEWYALSDAGRMMVLREGSSQWEEDLLDEDASLLPTEDISLVSYPAKLSDKTDYVLMAGSRDAALYPQETTARVWCKTVDYGKMAEPGRWVYIERPANANYQLPRMENLCMVKYDDGVLAFGKPYTNIYHSRDNGITWKVNRTYQMPQGFDSDKTTGIEVKVDDNNCIWLYCAGSGQVWRGVLNKLK